MKKFSMLLVSTLFFIISVWSSPILVEASEAEKVAHELLEVSGVSKMGVQITAQLIKHQRKNMPDIPEQFWTDVAGTLKSDGLDKKMVAVYLKHFNIEEMKTIVAFYKTTVGKKYLQKLPEITQESMAVGRVWNRELGAQIAEKLKTADLKNMKK